MTPPLPVEAVPVEGESVLGGGTFLHSLLEVGVQFLTSTSSCPQLVGGQTERSAAFPAKATVNMTPPPAAAAAAHLAHFLHTSHASSGEQNLPALHSHLVS